MNIRYRPLRDSDYDLVAALFNEGSIADGRPMSQVGEEIREEFESLPVDLDTNTFSAWHGDQLVGATYAYHLRSEERQECCYVFGSVHPSFRGQGIGRQLLGDVLNTAEKLLRESTSNVPKVIRANVSNVNTAEMHLLEREGLKPVRYFPDLHRSLASPPRQFEPIDFRVTPWDQARNEEIRVAKNLAFQDHWGSTPFSPERWQTQTMGFGSRLDLSFMALSPDDKVIGYLLSHRYDNDDALIGAKYAWIDNIGTLAEWRGRGVATHLITTALNSYRDAGLDYAALGVDSDNPTGAFRLYESLGFKSWRQTVTYEREVIATS